MDKLPVFMGMAGIALTDFSNVVRATKLAQSRPERPAQNLWDRRACRSSMREPFSLVPPLAASMGRAGGGGQFLNRGANKEAIALRRDACPTILSNY